MQEDVLQHIRHFGQVFHRTMRHTVSNVEHHAEGCSFIQELSVMQKHVLHYIIEHEKQEEVYQKEIEKFFCIRRSTASTLLKQLEDKGLITRQTSEMDRRLKRIVTNDRISCEFSKIYLDIDQKMKEISNVITEGLSDEELTQFVQMIDQMRENLEEHAQKI